MITCLQKICSMIQEAFFHGFGDSVDSQGKDILLPNSEDWQQLISINKPSLLYMRNMTVGVEFMFAFDNKGQIGAKVASGAFMVLDRVIGVVYAKRVLAGTTCTVNVYAISIQVNT